MPRHRADSRSADQRPARRKDSREYQRRVAERCSRRRCARRRSTSGDARRNRQVLVIKENCAHRRSEREPQARPRQRDSRARPGVVLKDAEPARNRRGSHGHYRDVRRPASLRRKRDCSKSPSRVRLSCRSRNRSLKSVSPCVAKVQAGRQTDLSANGPDLSTNGPDLSAKGPDLSARGPERKESSSSSSSSDEGSNDAAQQQTAYYMMCQRQAMQQMALMQRYAMLTQQGCQQQEDKEQEASKDSKEFAKSSTSTKRSSSSSESEQEMTQPVKERKSLSQSPKEHRKVQPGSAANLRGEGKKIKRVKDEMPPGRFLPSQAHPSVPDNTKPRTSYAPLPRPSTTTQDGIQQVTEPPAKRRRRTGWDQEPPVAWTNSSLTSVAQATCVQQPPPNSRQTVNNDETNVGKADVSVGFKLMTQVLSKFRKTASQIRDPRPPPERQCNGCWERPRAEIGLRLLGELAHPSVRWSYVLQDESRRSFVGYLRCPLSKDVCASYFTQVREGTNWTQPEGPTGPIPRKTAWMVAAGCECPYRYGGVDVAPQQFPPWMVQLLHQVMPFCGLQQPEHFPNSCNLNLYEDGGMSVGWHADDEALFQGKFNDCPIISLSLGAGRTFELRLNWPEGERPTYRVTLNDGDLCTMEGMTQKHLQHRVPREVKATGPRINLTWRWVVRHVPRCPAQRVRIS